MNRIIKQDLKKSKKTAFVSLEKNEYEIDNQ
ncbi:hypothetical protein Emtol_2964 [Emticicia oligotrophica DSM 17448]|uniref:Uncharacterized protein n=1 Tax=Emticicia oligotrophica (strain DSM 17448 / CIP 109782 / MTCC 6937 / GPTSA100-15) TaxID=929562 RepID=A0ABN4ANW0_EMTOG|nr:hypothetical protein Emtol_2964 [Emticicia oligotrophica DSM 17448]